MPTCTNLHGPAPRSVNSTTTPAMTKEAPATWNGPTFSPNHHAIPSIPGKKSADAGYATLNGNRRCITPHIRNRATLSTKTAPRRAPIQRNLPESRSGASLSKSALPSCMPTFTNVSDTSSVAEPGAAAFGFISWLVKGTPLPCLSAHPNVPVRSCGCPYPVHSASGN